MKAKLTFLAGLAAGYVLGTKAGRESYENIKRSVKSMLATEPVQDAVTAVKDTVTDQAHELVAKVGAHTGHANTGSGTAETSQGENDHVKRSDADRDISPKVSDEFPDAALKGGEGEHWDAAEKSSKPPAH